MTTTPRAVWGFAVALAVLTTLPYLIGSWQVPPGGAYSGAPAVPAGAQVDYQSHLAKMWQGARGQWAYRLLFTHEPHPGLPLVQGFYVALGALASVTPFSLPAVYHLARFLLTILMVLTLWRFAGRFFETTAERWLALLFATVAGGWSWLLLIVDPALTADLSPIEFWLSDAFNLLGALYMPHFVAAVCLQVVILLAFDTWVRGGAGRSLVVLALALVGQAIIQPYAVLLFGPLLVLLAAYHLFSTRRLPPRRALGLALPLGLYGGVVLYQAAALNSHPIWQTFTAQNITLSPLVTYYLLGYLPFILPMAFGLRAFLLDRPDGRWWMPILWAGLVAMLLYAPFPTQRRYLLGVQTPLAMMAAYGWSRAVLPLLRPRVRPLVTIGYLGVASVALVGMVAVNAGALTNAQHPAFYTPDEQQGLAWMRRETTGRDDLVLTTADASGGGSGGRLVAALGQRVYVGHWIETADFADKVAAVRRFYDPDTPDTWRKTFLNETGMVYIWYDEDARRAGAWNPAGADYLDAGFASSTVTIYRVVGLEAASS